MSTLSPELADLITAAVQKRLSRVYVALPGVVKRYDSATQQADVMPGVGGSTFDENGKRVAETIPVIPSCPVHFPRGGGYRITFPVQPGDTCLLVFCSSSTDRWLGSNGQIQVDPGFDWKHAITDAVAFVGIAPFNAPLHNAPVTSMSLGSDDGGPTIEISDVAIQCGGSLAQSLAYSAWVLGLAAAIATATPSTPAGIQAAVSNYVTTNPVAGTVTLLGA